MFDPLIHELSERYGLGDRARDLFGLLMAYIHNDRRGGFGGFIEAFREQGHGALVASWIGNPRADGLTASDVGMVFGQGLLTDWGTRLGTSRATVAAAIAGVLPRLVAELTPGGRIPGGFGAPAALGPAASRGVGATDVSPPPAPTDAPAPPPFASGPDGARAASEAPFAPDPGSARDAETGPVATSAPYDDAGRIAPGRERRRPAPDQPPPRSQPLRREPSFAPPPREPVAPRFAHAERTEPDAGDRLSEMTAAFDARHRGGEWDRARARDPRHDDGWRPEGWRPAMHPAQRRRAWGWLFWLVLLLVLIAGAGWFAWSQGLLNPYIEQFNLPIRTTPDTF